MTDVAPTDGKGLHIDLQIVGHDDKELWIDVTDVHTSVKTYRKSQLKCHIQEFKTEGSMTGIGRNNMK